MQLTQVRNATVVLRFGARKWLIDPMLCDPGSLPGFQFFGDNKRPNPLVPLPPSTGEALSGLTAAIITHVHADHVDPVAIAWLNEMGVPAYCRELDRAHLKRQGLDAHPIEEGVEGETVGLVPGTHGFGPVGWLMGPVTGLYIAPENEPSLYLTGDTVLTPGVRTAIERLRPQHIVAPAGCANFGRGRDILFPPGELVELARLSDARVIFNHLEALDHCPTTREELRRVMDEAGVGERVRIPKDGETLMLHRASGLDAVPAVPPTRKRGGFQKWLTSKLP